MNFTANGAGWPPDTSGDVGPNHYIQTVNTSVGIYNKATGAAISTVTLDTFFPGPAGSPCDTNNDGDPVVLYDPAGPLDRHRLCLVQFQYRPLLRVHRRLADRRSRGRRLVFLRPPDQHRDFRRGYFGDYPKLGVWSDGYYMSANMFEAVGTGFGVRLWGSTRLRCSPAAPCRRCTSTSVSTAAAAASCPATCAAQRRRPARRTTLQVAASNALSLYRFHVDWVIPANSTLTGPVASRGAV